MNAQKRHTAAAAKMDNIEKRFDKLFEDCDAVCKISAECADKIWADKYKSRYEAMNRLYDAAYHCYWYTSPDIPLHNKQVNHRATVAKMRAAGLHRMATVKKLPVKKGGTMMKLQNEFNNAVEMTRRFIEKHGEDKVRAYMEEVKKSGDYKNYEVRIANDIVKYYAIGCDTVCEWYKKYGCTDDHITTLCIKVMKGLKLL